MSQQLLCLLLSGLLTLIPCGICCGEQIDVTVFFNSTNLQTGTVDAATETWRSPTVTSQDGAMFQVQFDSTAIAGVQTLTSSDLGVLSTVMDDNDQFDVNTDALTLGNLSIQNFDPGTSGL